MEGAGGPRSDHEPRTTLTRERDHGNGPFSPISPSASQGTVLKEYVCVLSNVFSLIPQKYERLGGERGEKASVPGAGFGSLSAVPVPGPGARGEPLGPAGRAGTPSAGTRGLGLPVATSFLSAGTGQQEGACSDDGAVQWSK